MNLTTFKKIDSVIKITNITALVYCIILTVAFLTAFLYLSNKIDEAYTKALVIDTKGAVYETTPILSSEMRKYEYENHIKQFIYLWYAFDENNYERNINAALNLIGNKGKEMFNEYKDVNMLSSLIQKNIRYGVEINDININMSTVPVTGTAEVKQTGYRSRGSISRIIYINFSLYEVSRSRENVHGVKIEQWNVKYSNPIDQ